MNNKKLISLLLAVLLMSTRIGFALNIHYCGTHIAEISLASNPFNCGMEESTESKLPQNSKVTKSSCCADETILYQNQEPQKYETDGQLKFPNAPLVTVFELKDYFIDKGFSKVPNRIWNPPPVYKAKIYLLNQSFVVYG